MVRFQFLDPNQPRIVDLDDARRSDRGIERQGIDRRAVLDKMQRRIHVSSSMRAAPDVGEVACIAVGQRESLATLKRRIAGPMDHSVVQRKRDVDPVAAHEAIAITFFTPPAPLESGSIACSMGKRFVIRERTAVGQRLKNTPR